MQSYITNQPYFNRFTGKGVMTPSTNRPISRFFSLTSSEANTFNRYNTFLAASAWGLNSDKGLDLITKEHKRKPVSRQLENKKVSSVSMSGTTPLSTVRNIPITTPYKGEKLVNYLSNSYLFHNLFPLPNSYFLRRNDKSTSSSFYSSPIMQNAILTSSLPNFHKERTYSVTPHPVEAGSLRNRFTSVSQTNALPSNIGLYGNRHKITSSEKTTQRDNFQLTQYSTNVANDSAFRSPLNSAFYLDPTLLGKDGKISSTEDKVVTEGELKEEGLLSDILSRDHIRRKPGKVRKKQLRNRNSFESVIQLN